MWICTSFDIIYVSNVPYVPNLGVKLLFVSSLTKQGTFVKFSADFVIVQDLSFVSILASGHQDGLDTFTAFI